MQLKKIIALFCVVVLCMQLLPVQQLGAVLFNNQITEEIAHTPDCAKASSIEKQTDDYLLTHTISSEHNLSCTNNCNIHVHAAALVKLHVAEVQTPPPNLM